MFKRLRVMPANGRVSSKKGKEEREGESAGGETVEEKGKEGGSGDLEKVFSIDLSCSK